MFAYGKNLFDLIILQSKDSIFFLGIPELMDSECKCWTPDSGRWTLDAGLWTLDSGFWTLYAGRWMLDYELWTLKIQSFKLPKALEAMEIYQSLHS